MATTTLEGHISETTTQIGMDVGVLFDTKLAYLTSAAGFATATARQPVIHYDGSPWVRKAGNATPNGGTRIAGPTGFYYERKHDGALNVTWWGADQTGQVDASPAIQAAVDYAKTQNAVNGGTFRCCVYMPAGWYLLNTSINCTNTNGLIIKGVGGQYINTGVIGCTSNADATGQGIIFDFTGSGLSGLLDITVTSNEVWGNKTSKIGVLFALGKDAQGNQTGGLRPQLRNVYIKMGDLPTANGGYGSIAYVNVRAEETSIRDCGMEANTPVIFSNQNSMSGAGNSSCVFTSPFALINDIGVGSMTVIDMANVSLLGLQKRSSALILNGVSGLRFQGYIARETRNLGTFETAIQTYQSCYKLNIDALIETYQRSLTIGANCELINCDININSANLNLPDTNRPELVLFQEGCHVRKSKLKLSHSNMEPEMSGRNAFYCAPVAGGDSPTTCYVYESELSVDAWIDNSRFISGNLLNNCSGVTLHTGQSVIMRANSLQMINPYNVPIGTITSNNDQIQSTLIRFTKADKATKNSNNAGFYFATIKGTFNNSADRNAGGYVSCVVDCTLQLQQLPDGSYANNTSELMVLSNTTTKSSFLTITPAAIEFDMSSSFGAIRAYLLNTGSGAGQVISFTGTVEITSNFSVNRSMPYF